MNENFEALNEEQNLKNENEFLKMKLMLEQGAQFGSISEHELPPGVENELLHYVMAFEKQAVERKMIKVFDRIQRPVHFKPVNEIAADEIENAWSSLDEYLQKYSIKLSVYSPNISTNELYRFVTEELFEKKMNDMNIHGMVTHFTYDEFYPDHKYDNTRHAVEDCIEAILSKKNFTWMPMVRSENLRINDHYPLSKKEYLILIGSFKESCGDIRLEEIDEPACTIDKNSCYVKGRYDVTLTSPSETIPSEEVSIGGDWMVEYEFNEDIGFWEITNVQLEGIIF